MTDNDKTTESSASGSSLEFELHPELVAWINRESDRIVSLVEDLTEMALSMRSITPHPDLHIDAVIEEKEIIGELKRSITEAGKVIAHFYEHGSRFLGLKDAGMADAQRLAERIWSRSELRDRLSCSTILELLLEYVGASARGITTIQLSDKIIQTVNREVRPVSVWVPIEEVLVEGEFLFGAAVLSSLSRSELDTALNSGGFQAQTDEVRTFRDRMHSKWSGRTIMRLEFVAEPRRAQELAGERAADYMSLLQIFNSPAVVFPLVSHVAPRGLRPYREEECIVLAPMVFSLMGSVMEASYQFAIDSESCAMMKQLGLAALSNLANRPTCEYEDRLLESLLIYGRACYQIEPSDKLLQIMTAVEMFALRDGNEPIQAALADRLAFAISDDPTTRQEIARNLKDAYSVRSGRTHHGKSITETEIIETFLHTAWTFFLTALQSVGRYRNRIEFLDYLDAKKYGHGTNART